MPNVSSILKHTQSIDDKNLENNISSKIISLQTARVFPRFIINSKNPNEGYLYKIIELPEP